MLKQSILIIIIGGLNSYFNQNSFFKIFIYFQCIYLLYLLLTKQYVKTFKYHIFFVLCSPLFSQDFNTSSRVINYSRLQIFGLNYSYLFVVLLFLVCFFNQNKNIKKNFRNKKLKKFYILNLIMLGTATVIGVIGIIIDNNLISFFRNGFIYMGIMVMYFYILLSLFNKNNVKELKKIIYSLLIGGIGITLLLNLFGIKGFYGNLEISRTIDTVIFSSILVFKYKLFFILYMYLLPTIVSGKAIIIFLVVMGIWSYHLKLNKVLKLILLVSILILFFNLDSLIMLKENSILKYKYNEFVMMLKEFKLSKIPHSPRVRIIEIINLLYSYIEKPIYLLMGKGYGGYYNDLSGLFSKFGLYYFDFSLLERKAWTFYTVHDGVAPFILYHGLYGIIMYIYYSYYFLKKSFSNPLAIISFIWIFLLFYFNPHIMLIGVISSFIVLLEDGVYKKYKQ